MTGISGWHGDAPADLQFATRLPEMADSLPGRGRAQCLSSEHAALACWLDPQYVAERPDAGLLVAIDGTPRWADEALARIASDEGHGTALLVAYESRGIDALQQLGGAFALAIHDLRNGSTILAVDRMGIRPLCYALSAGGDLVFGSTTTAILASRRIGSNLSDQSIYNYMYFHVVPSPGTIYRDIHKLEPGQFIHYDAGKLNTAYYWTPDFGNVHKTDSEALGRELKHLLGTAVSRDAADKRTGAFLSGGLDSSTICGLANESSESPLAAYSIGFAQQGYDEIAYARIAASHFGLNLVEYYVTPDDIAEAMPIIATAYDEPFGNSSAVPAYFCARNARDNGSTSLLAGDGGDEIFAGNERYATQQIFDMYRYLPSVFRKYLLEPLVFGLPFTGATLVHKARRYIEQASVPMPERLQTYNYLHMNSPESVFDPAFLAGIDPRGPVSDLESWYARGENLSLVDRMLYLDWKLTLADNDIRKVNRMCETAGVHVEYPFLDDELVDFSVRIPAGIKLRRQQLRYFFKQAFADFLPREIIDKQKHGFGLPFGDWLRSSDHLREIVMPSLQNLRQRGIFRSHFIDDLLTRHQDEHAAYYGNIIWVLVMLEFWLAAHEHPDSRHD